MSRRKRQKAIVETTLPPPVENLLLALSSPRERAKGTIDSYLLTARNFVVFAGNATLPDEQVLRKYFLKRRKEGINERTLRKEFVHLKKLYLSNHLLELPTGGHAWDWPFTRDDQPQPKEAAYAPAFTLEEIGALILGRGDYSKMENFCLAVSTTWGLRREEILRIRKRDYNEETITIKLAKRREGTSTIRHILPEEIKPILIDYHPRLTVSNSLSYAFKRILLKSGLGEREGYGFHSIRRTLRTLLEWNLAQERLPLSLVGEFMGWSPTTKGLVYGGAAMLGVYSHPEILSSDPLGIDKLLLKHHPFLPYWVK